MKTFADWTDEIRALMNPPAPMADTYNFYDFYDFYDPAKVNWDLAEGIDKTVVGVRPMTELDRGRAIHDALEKLGGNEAFNGRRTGKSRLQLEWYTQAMAGTDINEEVFASNANGWIYLMAPSHAQARAYALKNKLPKTWRYIHMVDQMYGMRGCKILAVGSWAMNKSYEEVARMEEYMKSHEIEVEYV